MSYDAKDKIPGHTLLAQEQKVVPINTAFKKEPVECCCSNHHQPYLLNGQWVVSTSPACRAHYTLEQENQLIASKLSEGEIC
jgi:hypothetical protein